MEAEARHGAGRFVTLFGVPHLCGQVKDLLSQEWDMSAVGLDLSHEEPTQELTLPLILLYVDGDEQVIAHACLETFDGRHEELQGAEGAGEVGKGLLSLVIVGRDHRAKGLGRHLLGEVARLAVASFTMTSLYLTCKEDKCAFYERCGYCFVAVAAETEMGSPLLWMKKTLLT